MDWFVFNMDEGLLGAYPTRRAAVHEHCDSTVLRRYRYGTGGDYEYTFGYPGEETTTTAYVVRADRAGDWREIIEKWERAGSPMGRLDEPIDWDPTEETA